MLFIFVTITIFVLLPSSYTNSISGSYVGCFDGGGTLNDTQDGATVFERVDTADICVKNCREKVYNYALLWNATTCFCQNSYMDTEHGLCDRSCTGNSSQICGGEHSYSVYATLQDLPSPPASLEVINRTDSSLKIQWSPPKIPNGKITDYNITAIPVETFYDSPFLLPLIIWQYPASTTKTELQNLQPGTCYNISVLAVVNRISGLQISEKGCTEIGEPSEPKNPVVKEVKDNQIIVEFVPYKNVNGPVSAYQIIVTDDTSFDMFSFSNYSYSREQGVNSYIAAELSPEQVSKNRTFVVGDGRKYGGYYNPPLSNTHVHIILGVVSILNNVTKVRYGQNYIEIYNFPIYKPELTNENGSSNVEVGLSVAVGVFGGVLVLSIIVYIILRQRTFQVRTLPEHQELSLEGPIFEVESSNYDHKGYVPDEEVERVDHYKNLKQQVWNIPRNFLDIHSQMVGTGRYGNIMKGTVQQRGFPVPVSVYVIPDRELIPAEKHAMLQDLGILINSNIGASQNIIQLVGICETPDTLYVMVEQHPATLKDMLLESRCLAQNIGQSIGYSPQRICSLPERQLLETVVGIARAMNHLSQKKIVHKQIAARSILMAHGIVPKLTNFGIAQYNKENEIPDYTRWTAQEVLRGSQYVTKSDVWSFGCLLWEITALGGTPYADVPTSEVASCVMRGLRLPQLQLISDDLYQLMLQCWQIDLDERPSFHELTCVLENLLEDSTIHLNFTTHVGFHYEQYVSELERQ